MIYVVGSGPAGVSAAVALLRKGHEVTMLDAGLELESDRSRTVRTLAQQDATNWDPQLVARLKENMQSSTGGIPLKYIYGSDFPYRETDRYIPREASNVGLVPSLAKGGFSNVWGAAVLPYLESEMADWPITYDQLAPHYRSVLSFVGLAATRDDLESRFPLYSDDYAPMRASRQAESFLSDLRKNRERLQSRGFLFGYSRLAVFRRSQHGRECAACGLCMYGCPYGLIYSTTATLDELKRNRRFTYLKGVIVERFSETSHGVKIMARSRANGEALSFHASRVMVAAGVLSSTKMLLDSMQAYDRVLTLKDSQYFLLPLLRYRGVQGVASEPLHTLAQAFIEIFDENLSEQSIHLQVYTYNDLYRQAIQNMLGAAYPLFRSASNAFLRRFLLIQGYLHSDLSATVSVRLRAPQNGATSRLMLEGVENETTRKVLKGVAAKLSRHRSLLKAVPLRPMMKVGEPGRGFHAGGTLPMRAQPGDFETDVMGRPKGFRRVHIVDSSVFPSINASTITLTVMANAYRIASACEASPLAACEEMEAVAG
jgi:choline dehydrogenase-like flavoprotein